MGARAAATSCFAAGPGIEIHSASKTPARREESSDFSVLGSHPPIWYIPLKLNRTNRLHGFGGMSLCLDVSG